MFKRLIDEQSIQHFKYKERQMPRGDLHGPDSDLGSRIMRVLQGPWKQHGLNRLKHLGSSPLNTLKLSLPYFLILIQTAYLFFLYERVAALEFKTPLKQEIIQTINELEHDKKNTQLLAQSQDLSPGIDTEALEEHMPDDDLSSLRYLAYLDLAGERRALLICQDEELWLKPQQWCGNAMLKHIDADVVQLLIQQREHWLKREQSSP